MTLRTGRRRVRPHRVLEDTNAIAHPGPTALEAQRSGQHGQLSGDQMTQIHQRPVARQTRADRSHGGRAARQPVGEQADDKNQNAVDQTNPAAHPAHGAGKFNPIRAQRVRRRLQAARLLGRNHNRLQDVQRPRQARRQAVRQQAERRVTLRTIPASNPRTRRRLALIGPVTGQGAAAVRVERTRLKPCIEPSAGGNVLLAGLPRLIAKLHRPWPGGFLVRAGLSLSVPEDRLRLRPGNTRRTLPTVAHHPGQSINPSMWENRLRFYRTNAGDNMRDLVLLFFRADGGTARHRVSTTRATRDGAHLGGLFAGKIEIVDPGFGIDAVVLHAVRTEPLAPEQYRLAVDGLEGRGGGGELARLIDRLQARLGKGSVFRLEPVASHLPERAERRMDPGREDAIRPVQPEVPQRPLRLFDRPEPVDAIAEVPDGPPVLFTWRRLRHRIIGAEGPERIEPEWWAGGPEDRPRDYYRVEDQDGRRYWLFRAGLYRDAGGKEPPRWYIHGLYG